MIEAKITCITGAIQIPDLGMNMVQGDEVYRPEADARSSVDLQRAWRARGVTVVYVERTRIRRVGRTPKNPVFPASAGMPAFIPSDIVQEEKVIFNPDAIAERVAAILGSAPIEQRIQAEVAKQVTAQVQAMEGRITLALVGAVQEALAQSHCSTALPAPMGRLLSDDSVPVFVPSRIGDDGLTADIEVKQERGDDASLGEAAAALRAVRRTSEKP